MTNVLFVDSIQQSGTDTIYSLNRIGVKCLSGCPTPSQNPSATIIWPNMPQFLQRNIKKFNNGWVELYDTTKIVIIPACTVGQTWLFDSLYNKSATCTSNTTQMLFGVNDSVKTILINNIDTLKLSKSFGIIVFPDPYGKNKYFRLSGIENKSSYDSTSLYGEKVPNAWDFYNYNVGDVFCSAFHTNWNNSTGLGTNQSVILTKTITPTGYLYAYKDYSNSQSFNINMGSGCSYPFGNSYSVNNYTLNCNNLSNPNLLENSIYPGALLKLSGNSTTVNIVNGTYYTMGSTISYFGLDNYGRFYKYTGSPVCSYTNPVLPNLNAINCLTYTSNYFTNNNVGDYAKIIFGDGFGKVSSLSSYFEGEVGFNLTSFMKNGVTYFGPPNVVAIKNYDFENKNLIAYPNPVHSNLNLNITEHSTVRLFNSLGEEIYKSVLDPGNTIDTGSFPAGIFILLIETNQSLYTQKLVIAH